MLITIQVVEKEPHAHSIKNIVSNWRGYIVARFDTKYNVYCQESISTCSKNGFYESLSV